MRAALKTLPTTIHSAFKDILERIECQETSSASTALRTLTWCYFGCRPLQMDELRGALAIEEGCKSSAGEEHRGDDIIDCCLSLITHDITTGQVRFIHPSVQQWFDNEPQRLKLLSHNYMAETCFAYLTFNTSCFQSTYNCRVEVPIHFHPFYLYAAEFWYKHTKIAQTDQAVQRAFISFSQSENYWKRMQEIRRLHNFESYFGSLTRLQFAAHCGMYDFCNSLFTRKFR
jgi:hypothetical protein